MTDLRTQDEIMSSWKGDIREPLVTVRCMTYNHEPYIEDAIKGFLIQETDFPFQVLIHDDASTDNTAAIVKKYEKEYPLIIKGWYQSCNTKSMQRNERSVMRKPFFDLLTAKYQAICEGDDYWTDPNKLQMQVDFLENNPDYGMCYAKVSIFDQKSNTLLKHTAGVQIYSFDDIIERGSVRIPTLSICIRSKVYEQYIDEIKPTKRNWLLGDLPLWLYCYHKSKIMFLDTVVGVYRVLSNSASHFVHSNAQIQFDHSVYDIWFYFADIYHIKVRLYEWRNNREAISCYNNNNIPLGFKIVRLFSKNKITYSLLSKIIRIHYKLVSTMPNFIK